VKFLSSFELHGAGLTNAGVTTGDQRDFAYEWTEFLRSTTGLDDLMAPRL
jgi:hypothetical protein